MKRRKQSCALQQILWRRPTVVDLGKSRSYSMHYFFFNQAHKTEGGKHTNALFLCSPALYVSACLSLRAHWKQRAPPPSSFHSEPRLLSSSCRPGQVQQFDGHRYSGLWLNCHLPPPAVLFIPSLPNTAWEGHPWMQADYIPAPVWQERYCLDRGMGR